MDYFNKICSLGNLKQAFRHIAANRGGPGVDGVTIEQFNATSDQQVEEIAHELLSTVYRFAPAMMVELKKEQRQVAILTVRDRTVSQAIHQVFTPVLEPYFHRASYAYRSGRSAVQASADLLQRLQQNGDHFVLRCDIQHYFPSIDREILMRLLQATELGQDRRAIELAYLAICQPLLVNGQIQQENKGICQGASLSPLLSNLYLTPFDQYLAELGLRHFRFCDDLAIIVPDECSGQAFLQQIADFLSGRLRLRLHPQKQQIVSWQEGFEFLGFHLSPQGRFPSRAACQRLQKRTEHSVDIGEKAENIRRWESYFGEGAAALADVGNQDKPSAAGDRPVPVIVSLLLDLFRGNPKCFGHAYRAPSRYGYTPVARPMAAQDIIDHLLGQETLAVYPLIGDQVVFSCLDLDLGRTIVNGCYHNDAGRFAACQHRLIQYTRRIQQALCSLGLAPLVEDSGYKGYHLWLFFQGLVSARLVIAFWRQILATIGPAPTDCHCEIFPRESDANGSNGALIKLPLAIHPYTGRRSMFINDHGEDIANPQQLLAGVVKVAPARIGQVVEQNIQPQLPVAPIDKLLAGCNVVRFLCQKALDEKHLGHCERMILLYTLGQLGEQGHKYLHHIISNCRNYDNRYTQRQIEKKHPEPMGCRRIQETMADALRAIECRCQFADIPAGGYAAPILHVYPNATKNLGGKWRKK